MNDKATRFRELNDAFRKSIMTTGQVVLTAEVEGLPSDVKATVIRRIATYEPLTLHNEQHAFGSCELAELPGRWFVWRIDTNDPDDPEKTTRVLTVMLAKKYPP